MSLNDKELLELAAKAAGFEFDPDITDAWGRLYGSFKGDPKRKRYAWNPLSFDDDALRLAVKIGQLDYLGIEIQTGLVQVDALKPFENCQYEEFKSNEDPYAATRRAIVRAAAEIGKEMK